MCKKTEVVSRTICSVLFITAGVFHFVTPKAYEKIVPEYLPAHHFLVLLSGVFEVLGGIGLMVPATRRFSGYGLMALLVAVFPANVYMLQRSSEFPNIPLPLLWIRLPLQALLIYWVAACSVLKKPKTGRN